MKKFEKTYIGKGKQVANLDIVRISVKLEDLMKLAHNYEGTLFVTFEVARLQNEDNFGHTHTAYVNKLVETPDKPAETAKAPKKLGKTAKATAQAEENPDLPF